MTMIMNGDKLHEIVEDAEINNTLIENYKIRPLNGEYSSGWIRNGGTSFNSNTRVYWLPV